MLFRSLVLAVVMHLERGSREAAEAELSEIVAWRRAHQPGGRNGGSVFRNPPNDSAGRLIEACGLKGHAIGGAMISDKHANFIVNRGKATATHIEALIDLAASRVRDKFNVALEREVRILGGVPAAKEAAHG